MANHNPHDQLRSLWQSQTVAPFQMSPDELRQKMMQLNKQLKVRDSIVYVICLGETVVFTYVILAMPAPVTLKIGFFLVILAMGFFVGQIWLRRWEKPAPLTSTGSNSCVNGTFIEAYGSGRA